jgi:ABC-type sugar transport system ATPase subunit
MQELAPLLRARELTKSFSGVTVLHNVDFEIYPGEVHGLVGENGAGKSTLVKLISGALVPTHGRLILEGKEVSIPNTSTARNLGIVLMHQEPLTFPDLDVTENIFAGHSRNGKRFIDWKDNRKKARQLLDSLELTIDERSIVKGMSIADQQMVEIICALSTNARILIMDEPTSSLTPGEVKTLFGIMERLKAMRKAIVFIGHRLAEIRSIADRITVLRDGEKVWTRVNDNIDEDTLVRSMIGRDLSKLMAKVDIGMGDVRLKVDRLTLPGKFYDIDLEIRAGEIVGMAGLVGAGRTEVASAVFGVTPPKTGTVYVNGKEVHIENPHDAIEYGIAMVPEDRALSGLFLSIPIKKNMTFASMNDIATAGWISSRKENHLVDRFIKSLSIVCRGRNQPVAELSGGNQQKVVIAKWMLTEPSILLLDEPTRGIDIGAKGEVYALIEELAKQGKAILFISSEMTELIKLCDRIYVMCEGRISAALGRSELSEAKIMIAASAAKTRVGQIT